MVETALCAGLSALHRRRNDIFSGRKTRAVLSAWANGGEIVAWSSGVDASLQKECDDAGVTLARMEDGFIRSVGLGSDFNWPYSLVVDRKGIYYDPSRPSELEDILNAMPEHPDRTALLERAAALRVLILENGLTKYNTGFRAALPPKFPEGKKIVLVPGQVEDDASVRCGGFGMANLDLLRAVRKPGRTPSSSISPTRMWSGATARVRSPKRKPDVMRTPHCAAILWAACFP